MKKKVSLVFIVGIILSSLYSTAQDPQGCFLLDFQSKSATIPPYEYHRQIDVFPTVTITVDRNDTLAKVSKYVYGNNANPYMTQMISESVLLGHIRKLSPNIIRYPGGNISSVFFWNSLKDQPPADAPTKLTDADGNLNDAGYWYGKNTEGWTLSVANYYQMLTQTNSTGMITINYGYARYGTGPTPVNTAAHYAADWVRYDNGRTKFWEIGNESGGPWQAGFRIDLLTNQDGQPEIISGELYGEHFKIFADSMRAAADKLGHQIFIGGQLMAYDASTSWNPPDRTWNQGFFSAAGNDADFFIIHSYYTPYNENSPPASIITSAQTETINMIEYLKSNSAANSVDMKPVALTEWNIFAAGSKQMCSYINGMHAAIVLGEMIKQQYGQASRWDLANGYSSGNDMGMFNNKDEPGVPAWNPRPAFFYMYYFQKYFGDHMLKSTVTGSPNVICYASSFSSGEIGIVVINKGISSQIVKIDIPGFGFGARYYYYSLTGGTDNGNFSQKVYVNGNGPDNLTGGPIGNLTLLKAWSDVIKRPVTIYSPGYSIQYVLIDNGTNIIDGINDNSVQKPGIWPNPAKDFVFVSSPDIIERIDLLTSDGKILQTIKPQSGAEPCRLELNVPPGIYFVQTTTNGNIAVEKVIVPE